MKIKDKIKNFIEDVKDEVDFRLYRKKYNEEENRINELCKKHHMPYKKEVKGKFNMWCLNREDDNYDEEWYQLTYILDSYIRNGLCFEYKVNGEFTHEHEWELLLSRIMEHILNNDTVTFDECEDLYSAQELEVLQAFIKKLEEDRLKDNFKFNTKVLEY